MERHLQTLEEIKSGLSNLESGWKDDFALLVINRLNWIDQFENFDKKKLIDLLDNDYEVGLTIIRLFMEKSKDEFNTILKRNVFGKEPRIGKKFYAKNKRYFVSKLNSKLNLTQLINRSINKKYSWSDIILERLKAGRGSAIKGQMRGRNLEDFVEAIIKLVFKKYDLRCNFIGKNNQFVAKADFAIPNKENPNIVIEVKAYGATGSKQTDSIKDVKEIIKNKRHDTYFLFVTDGITWLDRLSDLKKIVQGQNEGNIYRIYTKNMEKELIEDLEKIKIENNL